MSVMGPGSAKAASAALAIQHHVNKGWVGVLSPNFVQRQLKALTPQELGAALDYINQGVDDVNLAKVSKERGVAALLAQPEVQSALRAHQATPMVISDVDKTILDGKQKVIAGMKTLLDTLGENGGNTHVISLRIPALGLPTDMALKGGNVQVNSTAYGKLRTFLDAGKAHLDDAIARGVPASEIARLKADREHELAEAGHGKFLSSQNFDAANPGRRKDYVGDSNEGDKYFFLEKIQEDDANRAAGRPSVLGLTMLHVVDDSPIPQALLDEAARPDARVILYNDVGELAVKLEQRGRIDATARQTIVAAYNRDVASGASR